MALSGGRGNNQRQIESVGINGDAPLEHLQRQPHRLNVTIIDGRKRSELSAGGMPHDDDAVRIAAEFGRVIMRPAERLCDVGQNFIHRNDFDVTVIGGDEHIALRGKENGLQLDLDFLPPLPTATVNPKNYRGGGR